MATIHVRNTVVARNNLGRFIAECDAAATRTVEQTVNEGERNAKSFAPKKTGALARSIKGFMYSARSGGWGAGTDHWKFQEDGTAPHGITGRVRFWWENEGREWFPGDNEIQHPGNPATHFLRRSYAIARRAMMEHARRNYP